ncbi:MAG: maleylpyruvate isomerase family mycothiol-dependent enzyme [Actinomycetota bacterium]|nr:maleylpyruvate isomerase family mycothiol-dependent enzyme [Actinomycetota bacterium]
MAYDWIVDALEHTWSEFAQTLRGRGERDFDALTPCPGWSVRDVVNHITGTELFLAGSTVPDATGPWPQYVRNSLGEMNEAFVASRRHLAMVEVLADFRDATSATILRLRSLSPAQWAIDSWSPDGPRPLHQFQEMRVLDSWIHLQDVHDALLEPTDDHGLGEEIVVNRFEAALPYVWAKLVAAPEGGLLRINLVGRLGRSIQVQVRGGRGAAVSSTEEVPLVEVTTAVALFWRRMSGRINAEAFVRASATDLRGDRDLAWRLAESLNVMP